MRFDVHSLEHSGGRGGYSWSVGISVNRGGVGGEGGGLGIRVVETKEGVVVHGGHGD